MILIKSIEELQKLRAGYKKTGRSVGFVPTMGALHLGHITLIKNCKAATEICICSIFVNPTQFNNTEDFKKYPVTIEKDIDMLEAAGCDVLFLPEVKEIYPPGIATEHYELGYLEEILEGKYRPGHFQGVCQVVDRLLSIVQPDTLFLGQKDYQQCMVIKKLIELKKYPTLIKIIPTVRETSGLAMSSRNMRLSDVEKKTALQISKNLFFIQKEIRPGDTTSLAEKVTNHLTAEGFKVDYVAIANAENLEPVTLWDGKSTLVALIAAYLNEVRLIDNLLLN